MMRSHPRPVLSHLLLASALACALPMLGCSKGSASNEAPAPSSSTVPPEGGAVTIIADEKGFTPSEVRATRGAPLTLIFKRTSDNTCAKEVVFPELKVRRPLPLNQAVAVALPTHVIAADSSIADTSASDAAPNLVPEDASTPTRPANDIDDRRVTAQIRSALVDDKTLSSMAHNVSIATNQQAVVLSGQVSSAEKDRVEALASQYAGTRQVVSQLLVKDP